MTGEWQFYSSQDCFRLLYNGWECIIKPEFTGWDYEAFPQGKEDDPLEYYQWANPPYASLQEAIDDFTSQAQCPVSWPDDEIFPYEDIGTVVLILKKPIAKTPKAKQRGTIQRAWAKMIKHRDGYKCVRCQSADRIEAHHLVQYKLDQDKRWELSNGETLCFKCHRLHHKLNGR